MTEIRPEGISVYDYLPDDALAKIETLVPKAAQDFTLDVNAYAKTVTVHFRWERPGDPNARANSIFALAEAAMCIDTLCKNLRAERDARRRREAQIP